MACLYVPALNCFLLEVIRFCWEEKNAIHKVLFYFHAIFTSPFYCCCWFLLFAFPISCCLWIVAEDNLSQFSTTDFEKILIWIQRFVTGWNKSPLKKHWSMQQSRLRCLTVWAYLILRVESRMWLAPIGLFHFRRADHTVIYPGWGGALQVCFSELVKPSLINYVGFS